MMSRGDSVEDRIFHRGEVGVIACIQASLFHPAPIPFNQIEIRGIRRKKGQLQAQGPGVVHHQLRALVAGIIQKEGDRDIPGSIESGDLAEQGTHTRGGNIGFIGEQVNLPRNGIKGSQHVEPLPSGGGAQKYTRKTPHVREKSPENKMSGVYEKNHPLSGLRLRQLRFEFFFRKSSCSACFSGVSALPGTKPVLR